MIYMERQIVPFTTQEAWLEARTHDLTSTDIPALFGLSPYHTMRSLWEEKKNHTIVELADTKRMKAGRKLESAIAELIAEDEGWEVEPFKDYIRIPSLRLGSSFDYKRTDSHEDIILEIKNVSGQLFKDWHNADGELEAPYHIELQAQHQMLVSGLKTCVIGVLFGGNDYHTLERTANPEIQALIIANAERFWRSIDENTPPAWDYTNTTDQELIYSLYNKATQGKTIESTPELKTWAGEYLEISKQLKFLNDQRDAIKAQITEAMKDAETVQGEGFKITAKVQKRAGYIVKDSESRVLRVTDLTK